MTIDFISIDKIFRRVLRYILKRYLGHYIDSFAFDDLNLGLKQGKASIRDVPLNVQALNELSEEYNLPVEFLYAHIEFVSVFIPWATCLSDNTVIEVKGLTIVIQPKERPQDVSMFDSKWSSMASSLQIAEDFLEDEDDEEKGKVPDRSEGVKTIAQTIDAFLSNLKIVFHDIILKVEHVIPQQSTGISLEIKINLAEYFDEAGVNAQSSSHAQDSDRPSYEPSSFSAKRVVFEGISLYTSEFLSKERSFTAFQQAFSETMDATSFIPGSPEMPPTHSTLPVKKDEPNFHEEPVLISRLSGQQELKLKVKLNEAVAGPKVDVEFNFGAFNLFLTPQQVHLLLTLISSLIRPSTNCDTSKKVQPSIANKPMRPADYALVEQELLRQQERSDMTSKSLKNQHGWSSHSLDESDEYFHLMTMENKMYSERAPSTSSQDDLLSSTNSDSRSDCASNYYTPRGRHRGSTVQAILTDPLSELTRFRGCFSSLLIIILHDDSVQETCTAGAKSASVNLEKQAETFFQDLTSLQMDGFNFKDFSSAREPLSKLCEKNHLRVMASGILLDGNESSSSAERILKFNISFHQFEVLECLFNSPSFSNENQNPTYMHLLTFPNKTESTPDMNQACFKLKYSQVDCLTQNRTYKPPANKLDIQFDTMVCNVDISLTDRIQTLLNFSSATDPVDNKWDIWRDSDIGIATQTSSKTEITLSSSNVTVNLRFPIPDLRSVHDMERAPWWQQNIHKEILILQFQEITLKTTLDDDELLEKYEIQCQDVHGLLQMESSEEPISFLRVSVDPDADEVSRNSGFDWPRLVIRRMTKVASPDFESGLEEPDELYSCSLSYALISNLVNEPSPFCSTSVIHDSKVEKETNSNLSSEHDEIIKPSDKENMQIFVDKTVNKSECVFEFTLPTVNIVFPDKDFFELLYNRIGNDLLLWTNTSLTSTSAFESMGFKVHIPGLDASFHKGPSQDQFPVFRPFINDSNSDSEEEETMYMSVHEYYQRRKDKQQKPNNANLTKYSLTFNITKGSLLINSPILDDDLEAVPDYCGKLQLQVEDCSLFLAAAYKGDPNESYMCLVADKSALFHDGMSQIENKHSIVEPLNFCVKNNLKCIIYTSEPGMQLKSVVNLENPSKEMLKFAIHVVKSPKQQIKTFKIAIEIAGATLRHYVVPSPQMWINQLIQFLKVNNYPVKGYTPPAVVTELHLNLSNCGIDYRPFKLPIRTALTVENFNMSCNVTATTPSFNFRIISEELRLLLSNNIDAIKVDLRKNYVCVIDSGLIDISIRTSVDEKDNPKLEMSISNNKVHIRTCADSFKALLDLVNYLSTNGDMEPNFSSPKEDENDNSFMKAKTVDSDCGNLDVLMAEAMKECSRVVNGDEKADKINPEYEYSSTDDEFCILEDDPGVGLIPKNGCPQVRILTKEPIRIIENHFAVPPGKSDVLKAPKHFPNPLFLLTLQEMSLVWHLYGGNDFKKKTSSKKNASDVKNDIRLKHAVSFSDQHNIENIAVPFCKVTPKSIDSGVVHFSMEQVTINNRRSFSAESWLNKGGPGRNHDVLMELQMSKVQFQQEVYSLDSEYSSRYILLINDIEIRDRLAISPINKFLYHYITKDLPRQSHANMIDIKAVYTRPNPKSPTEECSLRVSCKPLRLNVDQDSLMFLVDFFQEAFGVQVDESSEGESEVVSENVMPSPTVVSDANMFQNTNETFYRYFSFSPDVLIRIDYHGKRVQMEQGALKGLVLGLGQLNASEIRLKRLCYRHGLLGHKKLVTYAINEWQQDILKNQLPSLLGGVGPMYSFVQLFQGVKDLFYLPVVHYRRDGQIVRGLQKGASSFSTSTVVAALDLASRFFYALQGTAELGFDMVSPGPRVRDKYTRSQKLYRKNSQPADIIEGLSSAMNVMTEGFQDTARTIYRVAATEHEHKGVPGAVGGVLRQIPPSLFRPIILSSEATGYVLDGARHQLMPDAHQEDIHKWKTKNN